MTGMDIANYTSEALTVALSACGITFSYGKLAERVKVCEDNLMKLQNEARESINEIKRETASGLLGLRNELHKRDESLDLKFKDLERQIGSLQIGIYTLRDKLSDELTAVRQLLFEIKGRLEERKISEK